MNRPTERIYRAIVALEGNPNWEEFKKWLDASLVKLSTDHIHDMISSEAKYRVLQGQARELLLLKTYIARARDALTMSEKERENIDQHPNVERL